MKRVLIASLTLIGFVEGAFAAANLTAPTLSVDDYVAIAGAVLVASGIMWGIKKGLGLVRA